MLEERGAGGVRGGERGVGLEGRVFGGGEAAREVFAVVEVFEDRACGREVVVWEVNAAVLWGEGWLAWVWLGEGVVLVWVLQLLLCWRREGGKDEEAVGEERT